MTRFYSNLPAPFAHTLALPPPRASKNILSFLPLFDLLLEFSEQVEGVERFQLINL